jgi:hypothetical protein
MLQRSSRNEFAVGGQREEKPRSAAPDRAGAAAVGVDPRHRELPRPDATLQHWL